MSTIDNTITSKDMMSLIYGEIDRVGLAGHHIDSMNSFYTVGMTQIMTQIYKIETRMHNVRDNNDEDKSIQELSSSVVVTKVHQKKPKHTLLRSGKEVPLYPQTAKERGITYSCDILVDADIIATAVLKDGTTKSRSAKLEGHRIGAIPCMEGSILCNKTNLSKETLHELGEDPNSIGGTFVINGTTWSANMLENITYNAFHVQKEAYNKELARGMFISKAGDTFENSFQHIIRLMQNGAITFDITTNRGESLEIPFYLLFRALGMTSDKDIVNNIVYGINNESPVTTEMLKILQRAFEAPVDKYYDRFRYSVNSDELVTMLGKKIQTVENEAAAQNNDEVARYVNIQFLNLVDKNIMSHIGIDPEARPAKLRFIAHLINELLCVHLGIMEPTDRDSYKNKRISAAGICIAKSFKQLYNFSVCKEIIKQFKKEFKASSFSDINLAETVKNAIKPDELERLLAQSITASNKVMTIKKNEVKNRISSQAISTPKNDIYIKAVLGTIAAPNFSPSKQTDRADEMRRVHQTFPGYVDVSMSADTGELVGMNKQKACTASVCQGSSSFTLKKIINKDPDIIKEWAPEDISTYNLAKVFVNGDWVGVCKKAHEIVRKYRMLRREAQINKRTTIVWEPLVRKVIFLVDVGRVHRPLVIVHNNIAEYNENWRNGDKTVKFKSWINLTRNHIKMLQSKKISMEDLENDNIIEYISAEEQENTYLAPNIDVLRQNANSIKHMYTHCDIDQAIFGIVTLASPLANYSNATRITYFTNHRKQSAGWFAMNYPYCIQKNTMMQWSCERPLVSTITDSLTYPTGHNCIVAIASYKGTPQEDSTIYCQTAVDCSLYNASYYTFERSELEKDEIFENVDRHRTKDINTEANYEYIVDGAIKVGSPVVKNTVLICKSLKLNKPIKNYTHIDKSTIYTGDEQLIVEAVIREQDADGVKFIKVKLRSQRHLSIGDKMSSRTGNKGICSRRCQRIDMPYTEDGMRCSIIGGPHSFPSRMAVNQLIEGGLSARAARMGMFIDGTIFQDVESATLADYFPRSKTQFLGSRKVMNGETNEWFDSLIFMVPNYYLRLQKFTIDSQYAMNDGPTTPSTRQPLEGRANDGGLRMGEMETWVYVAQGAMRSLDEKFYLDSDGHNIPICRCGRIAIINKDLNIYRCNHCGDNASIGMVSSSWMMNRFNSKVQGMNGQMLFELEPYKFEIS